MTGRSFSWPYIVLSSALTLLFIGFVASRIDLPLRDAWRRVGEIDPRWIVLIVVLHALNSFLAGTKWRACNVAAHRGAPRRMEAFGLSLIGMGVGQFLPSQIAGALVRAVGARLSGATTALRGGATTVFEQAFDVIVVFYLALASLAAYATGANALGWFLWAALFVVIGLAASEAALHFANAHLTRVSLAGETRIVALARAIVASGCANRALGRKLYLLSLARFCVVIAIATATSAAIGIDMPVWRLAASAPFAVLAVAAIATPGGVGANEAAMATALVAFGAPLGDALQWTIAARLITMISALCLGALGVGLFAALYRRARS